MRFLRSLSEGDRFRPAHPKQTSLNGKSLSREATYKITKVYSQAPYTVIAVREDAPDSEFYSMRSGTPVLLPKELDPSLEEIVKFLTPNGYRRVVAYRVLWDGKTPLTILPAQAAALIKMMFVFGKTTYPAKELHKLVEVHYEKFLGRQCKTPGTYVVSNYRRVLVDRGYLEEIVDLAPKSAKIVDANLQEVL